MKKYITLFAVAIVAMSIASCRKNLSSTDAQPVQGVTTTIQAGLPEISKVALSQGENCLKTAWEIGDQLFVVDANSQSATFTLVSGEGTQSAAFAGSFAEEPTGPYTVTIVAKEERRIAVQNGNADPSNVIYTASLKGVADISSITFSEAWAAEASATFESSSVLKFIIKLPADAKNVTGLRFNDNGIIAANAVSELSTAVENLDASASAQVVTVYVGVEKNMTVSENEPFTVTVTADGNSYLKHIVIPQEKVIAGKCFTVQLNADNWVKMAGTGVQEDPFILKTAADLQEIAGVLVNAGDTRYFSMANDIDLAGIGWKAIVSANAKKAMYFDGNDKVISNLTVSATDEYASFAGEFTGTIRNVKFTNPKIEAKTVLGYAGVAASHVGRYVTSTLENVDVEGADFTVGAFASPTGLLAGDIMGSANVSKCDVAGKIQYGGIANQNRVAGLIGDVMGKGNDEISDCTTNVDITVVTSAARVAAGFIGRLYNVAGKTVIKDCAASGSITMNNGTFSAGFIGAAFKSFEITNCSTSVSLSGVTQYCAGFLGTNNANAKDSFIKGCSATGNLTLVKGVQCGDFIGALQNILNVEDCTATGNVTGTTNGLCRVGGFCGDMVQAANGSKFKGCGYSGTVDVTTGVAAGAWLGVGGFVGTCDTQTTFENCWTEGSLTVSDGKVAAGFIGLQSQAATIRNCYSIMDVNHLGLSQYVGGLLGRVTGANTIVENSFYSGAITTGIKGTNAGCSIVGGIVAGPEAIMTVRNSFSSGAVVNANDAVGGIAGQLGKSSFAIRFENCYSTMSIDAATGIGGIIGKASSATAITNPALASSYVVSKCIAWNSSIKSVSATKINPANSFGAGAVVGYVLPASTLTGCVRKAGMTFDCYAVPACNTLFDQSDASASTPLSFEGLGIDKPAHFFPYHGTEAGEFDTISSIAQGLEWSNEIWDFSSNEPLLKNM